MSNATPEIQLTFPTGEKAYFVFSYMGHANIYKRLDLKKELVKIILKKGGTELVSYTDSTIIFTGQRNTTWFNGLRDLLNDFCSKYNPKIFFSLAMALQNTSHSNFIVWSGDKELNEGFQKVVAQARAEIKPRS